MDLGSLTDCFCILRLGGEERVSKVVHNAVEPSFEQCF